MLDHLLALVHGSAALLAVFSAQQGPSEPLQPATYRSPAAQLALHVDPSERFGAGPGIYTLTRGEQVLWRRELPVTLWSAGVADSGRIAGYGYSAGYLDGNAKGSLHVLILDSDGGIVLDDRMKREPAGFHSPPDPRGGALVVHEDIDRVFVEIRSFGGLGSWRAYRFSTAERLSDWEPSLPFEPKGRERLYYLGARAVPGTSLVLVNWKFVDFATGERGGVFSLHDAEGRRHWKLERRRDYMGPGQRALDLELRRTSAILDVDEQAFSLWFPSEGARARFSVSGNGNEWVVAHDGSEPLTPPSAEPVRTTPMELKQLGTTPLGAEPAGESPASIRAFDFTDAGQLEVIRGEGAEQLRYQRLGAGGVVQLDVALDAIPADEGALRWFGGDGDTWYAVAQRWGDDGDENALRGAHSDIYAVDVLKGTRLELESPQHPLIERVVPRVGGGFLALGTYHGSNQLFPVLLAFDRNGRTEWRLEHGFEDEASLFSPVDVTTTTDGVVVVLDVIRKRLQLYSNAGAYLRYLDLAEALGVEPDYPARVEADEQGGVWIRDHPRLWHLSLDGDVLGTLEPRLPGGASPRLHQFAVSPGGDLWYSDRRMLAKFGENGLLEETVGVPPSANQLQDTSMVWIDRRGRIIIEDRRTGVWHVFTERGDRLFVCAAPRSFRPASFATRRVPSRLSPDGEEVGPGAPWPGVGWYPDYPGLVRLDAAGEIVTRLDRDPANEWWSPRISAYALSADSSTLAVVAGTGRLSVFDGNGRNGKTIDVTGIPTVQVAASDDWVALAGYGTDLYLLRLSDMALHRAELPSSSEAWRWGFAPSGEELWGVQFRRPALTRFALPAD